ncbi:hypothetical protein Tsubulata_028624 [Turnera subulata]|uniref:Phytocyanin domain-containing protein n=1 Tax=Turnera subulata TaxID=218843 RepID=A0A9Q0FJW7_9ROSI|nr:hypothetical protein Tsubulata_028624 [Turnera subulata]
MKKMAKMSMCSAALLLVVLCYAQVISAEVYNVGDGTWRLGQDYTSWAAGKRFALGDTLVFTYIAPHTVAEVSASAASACDGSNPIFFSDNHSTFVRLTTPGDHFFISTAPGDCQHGMKLKLTVAAATTAP